MTLMSRPYSFHLLLAGGAVLIALLAAPGLVSASTGGKTPQVANVLEGKVPVCSGLVQILNPNTGQPIIIAIEPVSPCPGPPANIDVLSTVQTTTCGSSELLTLDVTDWGGFNVQDGTSVSLSTNLGQVPETVSTRYGIASASFLALSQSAGRAEIVIRAGAALTIKVIDVTCS